MNNQDVTVIGGGLAGMAAAIHLSRAGFRVLCVEPDRREEPIGESLDWSAPELLKELGFPMERLTAAGTATYKRHVVLQLEDGRERQYVPGTWLGDAPWHVELRTLHVDRAALDGAIREVARQEGVDTLADRVVHIERDSSRRVHAVVTEAGRRLTSPWFLDASGGSARLFPREFQLRATEYGPAKVAIWSYFDVTESVEGTTLYGSATEGYMDWVWQIPIRANRISVGCVMAGDRVKQLRARGKSVVEIYADHLRRFPALQPLVERGSVPSSRVVSFRCRVHERVTGPNWIVIGEAASMIDPMTSNGVTAALRQARESAALVTRSRGRMRLPRVAALAYSCRVTALARFFNCSIERIVYNTPVRRRIGALIAGDVYTIPAWVMNLVYTRLAPRGMVSTGLYCGALIMFRGAAVLLQWCCRQGSRRQVEECIA